MYRTVAMMCVSVALFIGATLNTSYANDRKEIVVFLPSASNPFWIEVRAGAEEAASEHSDKYSVLTMASGDLDASSQVEQLENVLRRHIANAIVIGVANNRAPAALLAEYNNAHIPVILIDTKLDEEAAKQTGAITNAFVGSDNRTGGDKAAKAMVGALKEKGKRVLLIKGKFVHQSAIDRAEGFEQGAKGRLEIVERDGEWSRQRANEITSGVMSRDPVDGIFASNDEMALGAIAALKNLHLSSDKMPIVIGFDATPAGMDAINNGDMYASVKQNARGMGVDGVNLAIDLLEGKSSVPKETLIPTEIVPKNRSG
jgi:ABC-type sugar transport system substrate-binding protein